jgi:hypothetical protein
MERVVAYASKGLTSAQKKFHPMEGECYALIWGVMHFRQYLHRNHFILRTDHKPLEWLATVSDAHGRRGRWIDMLQDFSFKIVHRPGMRHTNVDALSRNPVGKAADDDNFSEEVQDIGTKQDESVEMIGGVFFVRHGEESKWFGLRRHSGGPTEHHRCCFGINHWRWSEAHQLFMLDALAEASQDEEDDSFEEDVEAVDSEEVRNSGSPKDKRVLTGRPKYYSRQQQLELVLAAQELLKYGEHDEGDAKFDKQEACDVDAESIDIWEDEVCLELLKGGVIPDTADL